MGAGEKPKFISPAERLRLPKPSDFVRPIQKPKPRPETAAPSLPISWNASKMTGLKPDAKSDRLIQKIEASRLAIKQLEGELSKTRDRQPPKPPSGAADRDAFDRCPAADFMATSQRLNQKIRKQRRILRKRIKRLRTHGASPGRKKSRPDSAYDAHISSPEWSEFREKILETRGRVCEGCGAAAKVLHLHHMTYKNFGHERPEDVCILCVPCHESVHGKRIGRSRAA